MTCFIIFISYIIQDESRSLNFGLTTAPLETTEYMKRYLFLLLVISIIGSCGRDAKPVGEKVKEADFKSLVTPVPFAGDWISERYYNDLMEHHSPRKAQEGSEDCFIHIPGQTLTPTFMVYNFHEGGAELVPVYQMGTYQLWEKQGDTLYRSAYSLESLAENKLKIGDKTFVKITAPVSGERNLILEGLLFAGLYTAENGAKVEFKSNGEVSGLGAYKYFDPLIDYFDAGLQVDQVGLGETREQMEYFAFKFQKDKLELYTLKCKTYDEAEQRCVEVDFGKRVHVLKKVTPDGEK